MHVEMTLFEVDVVIPRVVSVSLALWVIRNLVVEDWPEDCLAEDPVDRNVALPETTSSTAADAGLWRSRLPQPSGKPLCWHPECLRSLKGGIEHHTISWMRTWLPI